MKLLRIILLAVAAAIMFSLPLLFFSGCDSTGKLTPQSTAVVDVARPLAEAAVVAAAAHYGVPPSSSMAAIAAVDSIWGAYIQAQNGQAVAQGSTVPAIGQAIASKLPANATQAQAMSILQSAAENVTAQ